MINQNSSRIKNLMFDGKPIDENQQFIVATNNYRASGKFPGVKQSEIIIKSPDENRNVIIDYIMEKKTIDPQADGNWSFAPVKGNTNVVFETSLKAQDYIKDSSTYKFLGKQDSGFGKYSIKLKQSDATNPGQEKKFNDVSDKHWAKQYIEDLAGKGIIKGKSDTLFDPKGVITRAEFAALVSRTLGLEAKDSSHFKDVNGPLAAEINAAFEAGITKGMSKDKFSPKKAITREQMAAMLVRAYNYKTGEDFKASVENNYPDKQAISPIFTEAVNATLELEFMSGYTNNKFAPKHNASRAEAAKTIFTLLNK
jgi:2',3'-cyclic-nucleotide 2'-phosphodiesterase / 3'-nucleotidase